MPMSGVHKCMLRKPLRGLDGFPLVPRYKPPQMQGVIGLRMGMIERNQENRVPFERVGKELGVRLAHDCNGLMKLERFIA